MSRRGADPRAGELAWHWSAGHRAGTRSRKVASDWSRWPSGWKAAGEWTAPRSGLQRLGAPDAALPWTWRRAAGAGCGGCSRPGDPCSAAARCSSPTRWAAARSWRPATARARPGRCARRPPSASIPGVQVRRPLTLNPRPAAPGWDSPISACRGSPHPETPATLRLAPRSLSASHLPRAPGAAAPRARPRRSSRPRHPVCVSCLLAALPPGPLPCTPGSLASLFPRARRPLRLQASVSRGPGRGLTCPPQPACSPWAAAWAPACTCGTAGWTACSPPPACAASPASSRRSWWTSSWRRRCWACGTSWVRPSVGGPGAGTAHALRPSPAQPSDPHRPPFRRHRLPGGPDPA